MDKKKRQAIAKGVKGEAGEGRKGNVKGKDAKAAPTPIPAPEPEQAEEGEAGGSAGPVAAALAGALADAGAGASMPPMPKLPSMSTSRRARKAKETRPCACGCGTGTGRMWAPGHDARAKGWAIRIERNICKMGDVPEMEREGARLMLKIRKAEAVMEAEKTNPNIKLVDKAG